MLPLSKSDLDRFKSKIDFNGPKSRFVRGCCHVWIGAKFPGREYGQFWYAGTNHKASRIAYQLHYGVELSRQDMVLHKCGNASCVRGTHLYVDDHKQNMRDRDLHGTTAKGSKHWATKFTDEDIREIRLRRSNGESYNSIANDLGVTRASITRICKGLTWNHVDGEADIDSRRSLPRTNARFTVEEVHRIRELLHRHTCVEIAAMYDTRPQMISNIKLGKTYANIPIRKSKAFGNFANR